MEELSKIVSAIDHQAEDGSVVHSAVKFADAVLGALNENRNVVASLLELKGASSSYFNVFLRRIDEECGIESLRDTVEMQFDSRVQEMMFNRSHSSMRRGVKAGMETRKEGDDVNSNQKGLMGFFRRLFQSKFT